MNGDLIHTDFVTVKKYEQHYRISTEVRFDDGRYKCKALLWKSSSGKVRGEPLLRKRRVTGKKSEVQDVLDEMVDTCMGYMDDVEDANSLDLSITVEEVDQ